MFNLFKHSLAFHQGRSDMLSYQTARLLLGSPTTYHSSEIIFSQGAVFTQACIFTLSGAHYERITFNDKTITANTVYAAYPNDVLKLGKKIYGYRLYLMASPLNMQRIGYARGAFSHYFAPAPKKIRVIKSAEYSFLHDPKAFLHSPFKLSLNADLSGIRLDGIPIKASSYDIISSVVADGTIQLTRKGAIVLLRQRQITGGYPRILSVINPDLDFLAQYQLGMRVRFELISLLKAQQLLLQRQQALQHLAQALN